MKRKLSTAFVLMCCGGMLAAGGLNVRDFGAKGDGVTDDTNAFYEAVSKISEDSPRYAAGLCPTDIPDRPPLAGVGETAEVQELVIPAGTYKLSKTIVLPGTAVIRGEEGAVIEMSNPDADIFYSHWGFRLTFSGLTFRGGNRQILVCTCNNESARIIIRDCRFEKSGNAAVDCRSYLNPDGTDYRTLPRPAYNVEWDGFIPILTPNSWEGYPAFNNSTLFVCRNSEFDGCGMAIDVGADGASFNDLRITAEKFPAMRIGFPYNGAAYFNNIHATAETTGDEAWIENHAYNLAVRNCVFDGAPRALVDYRHPGKDNVPNSILLTDDIVTCSGTPDSAIIRIKEPGNTPCITEIFRVTEASDSLARAMVWDQDPTLDSLSARRHIDGPGLDAYKATLVEWPYFISMGQNQNIDETLPAALAGSFSETVFPDDMVLPAPEFDFPEPVRHLKAADFGVDSDRETDDTEGMKKALAAAAETDGLTVLEMPVAMVKISLALELPPQLILTAPGRSWIVQTTKERPIFVGKDIRYFKVENFIFSGDVVAQKECGCGFDLQLAPDGEAEWVNCGFYSINHAGISAQAGRDNTARVRVADSTFMTVRQVLDTDASCSEISNSWISSYGMMDEEAVIVNRHGGNMRITNMLTVPCIMKYHYPPHLPWVEQWPNSDHLRWVDNYGRLFMQDNRFGGEWMGFPMVYNWDPRGEIYMDGGTSCFFHPSSAMCALYCMYPPALAVIRNMGWKMTFPDSALVLAPEFMEVPEVFTQNILY